VPPLSLALRGGSLPYWSRRALNLACCRAANADLGTDKMGSGAVVRSTPRRDGPSLVQGQSPISAKIRIVERNQRVEPYWLRRPGGSAPWTPDGVPPLSWALRGGNLLYYSRRTLDLTCCRAAKADLGTDKMGSGAVVRSTPGRDGPSGSRAEPWPLPSESNLQLPVARASISLSSRLWGRAPGLQSGRHKTLRCYREDRAAAVDGEARVVAA
jgi:hypothetical protein